MPPPPDALKTHTHTAVALSPCRLADLQGLSDSERNSELGMVGFDAAQIESVNLHLSAQPRLNLAVRVEADEGDSEIQIGDIGHCRVSVNSPEKQEGFRCMIERCMPKDSTTLSICTYACWLR